MLYTIVNDDTVYGNGAWPLLVAYERGEVATNGNYLESDAISVRHGICGDPEQVRTHATYPLYSIPRVDARLF